MLISKMTGLATNKTTAVAFFTFRAAYHRANKRHPQLPRKTSSLFWRTQHRTGDKDTFYAHKIKCTGRMEAV